jgi:hypothetical protein
VKANQVPLLVHDRHLLHQSREHQVEDVSPIRGRRYRHEVRVHHVSKDMSFERRAGDESAPQIAVGDRAENPPIGAAYEDNSPFAPLHRTDSIEDGSIGRNRQKCKEI